MAKSLRKEKVATITPCMMFWGVVLIIVLMIVAFIMTATPPLA